MQLAHRRGYSLPVTEWALEYLAAKVNLMKNNSEVLDSTVLAHVLTKLNKKHGYGLNLVLLCIDEGIKGFFN